MPRSNRSLLAWFGAILLLAVPATTGCGQREPTASEAGATLKSHILRLIDEVSYESPQVTDPGGKDIPCGNGRVKRTFAATGPDSAEQSDPRTLNTMMLSAVKEFADYRLTGPGDPNFDLINKATRTSIHLNSSKNGTYSASGETYCLSPS
ncbi:hypothetical protein [Spongiactinospora sp. TRM90649]|uniref:hypothetical protein n=1 Tax=Spongiactinospora sp. TRM90649 TaxID=3031114 RepID=UPI0023F99B10|nr:hypothetical protein [Spongiactinospora sp. TRM90649]MDF5756261.1 hypothetical protein [Spongiactinospora sp. TRM90649]